MSKKQKRIETSYENKIDSLINYYEHLPTIVVTDTIYDTVVVHVDKPIPYKVEVTDTIIYKPEPGLDSIRYYTGNTKNDSVEIFWEGKVRGHLLSLTYYPILPTIKRETTQTIVKTEQIKIKQKFNIYAGFYGVVVAKEADVGGQIMLDYNRTAVEVGKSINGFKIGLMYKLK